ncbi:hypothetical protein cypCar_00021167 [Cyprinus carpio]|nr:hypothetical protein cypCar_00021167 [Cyprinus carpio]
MGGKLSKRKKGYDVSDPKEKKEESAVAAVEPAEKKAETPVTESEAAPQEADVAEDSAAALEEPAPVLEEPVSPPKLEESPVEPVTEEVVEKVVEEVENTSQLSTEITETTDVTSESETVTEAAAPEPVAESAPVPEPVSEALSAAEVEMAVPSPEEPTPVTEPESETAAPPEVTLTQASPESSPEPTQSEPVAEQKSAEESIPAIVILESTSTNELCLEEPASTVTDLKLNNGDCESAGSAEESASAPREVNGECHEQAPDVAPADVLESPVEACVNGVKDKETPQELSDCELKKDLNLAADFQAPAPVGDMVEVPQ